MWYRAYVPNFKGIERYFEMGDFCIFHTEYNTMGLIEKNSSNRSKELIFMYGENFY